MLCNDAKKISKILTLPKMVWTDHKERKETAPMGDEVVGVQTMWVKGKSN